MRLRSHGSATLPRLPAELPLANAPDHERIVIDVATRPINVLSLFAGVGCFDLALRLALPAARTVCYVERELTAAGVLVSRMQAGDLDEAPVWSDMGSFDGRSWRGIVDVITASPPCQPYSVAGSRKGNADERAHARVGAPIPALVRVIDEVRPRLVLLENVGEWVTDGYVFDTRERISAMGYRWADPVFLAAGDAGAPHRRRRVFLGCVLGNTDGPRLQGRESEQSRGLARPGAGSGDVAPFPPGPGDAAAWRAVLADRPDLAPAQPALRELADGPTAGVGRVNALRALGNALVPLQAAVAIRYLLEDLDR